MLDKFWESLGEDLAGKWLGYVFSPAFLFWAGGLSMYVLRDGWLPLWQWLSGLQIVEQTALLVIALLVLVGSALLMQRLRFSVLRLLEGYWPWPFKGLAPRLAARPNRRFEGAEQRWNALKTKEAQGALSPTEARALSELEARLHYFPTDPRDVQPTTLGNILRAAETLPTHKYGLDAFVCWPRLWLLLPESAREDLSAARQGLMTFVELWAWGLLFLVWAIFSPWALLVSVLWLGLASALNLQAAMAYADLFEAAFDLYRWELYRAAHWPLPQVSGDAERSAGQRLTEFLWRGTVEPPVKYAAVDRE